MCNAHESIAASNAHTQKVVVARTRKVATTSRSPDIFEKRVGDGTIIDKITGWGSTYENV